jgi:hypothetical protein
MEKGKSQSLRPSKLIPRDISESLGKLPPQAIELEEAVLGAVILESNNESVKKVVGFLRPEHFYKDAHQEVYKAILSLIAQGVSPDMRSVVAELKKAGKIELVGGAYIIAELTTKVSNSLSIEFHSRVIVEHSVKRKMISIASTIHHNAYEDTSNALELLAAAQKDLLSLDEQTFNQSGPERIKALWKDTLLLEQPPDQNVLITLQGKIVASSGNHSLIVGKKKSRKTLFIIHLIAEYLKIPGAKAEDIALFDTEQGKSHVWKIREKLYKLTGLWIPIFYLRGMGPFQRREFIQETVKHWPSRLKLIVTDGIRDCMSNINDPDETTEVIVWLEKLTLENDLHVINILHLNKTDGNPRGHIGSELQNKAQITIEMEKDEKTGHTIVKCESSREEEFDPFAFTHGPEGLPMMVDMPIQGQTIPEPDRKNRLAIIFESGRLKHAEFVQEVREQFACGETKAKQLIAEWRRIGWVVRNGKERSPDATYHLMIHAAMADHVTYKVPVKGVSEPPPTPPLPTIEQQNLFTADPDWVTNS